MGITQELLDRETARLIVEGNPEERRKIGEHLQANPNFYRYMQIFFHSGSRSTELFSVKV